MLIRVELCWNYLSFSVVVCVIGDMAESSGVRKLAELRQFFRSSSQHSWGLGVTTFFFI